MTDSTNNWGMYGHEWAVAMLRQHILRGALRHAYLLTGPPGLGRRTLALRLSQALNCTNPPAPGEACGACRDCQLTAKMQHPDMNIIQAETEGGTLKVDQVRSVQHALSLKPYQSRRRVAIFLRFQEANANAANALLKTLEEAPAHAILLLTADNAEQLLPTITSRCEILRLRPLPLEAVQACLQARGADAEAARQLAHISGGRPGYALRLMENPEALEKRLEQLEDLQRLLGASRADKFRCAEKVSKDKTLLRQTLLVWLSYWRDVLLTVSGADLPLSNLDQVEAIQVLANRLDLSAAHKAVSDLGNAVDQLEKNVNPRLLTEALLMDWPSLA
ncbi:MAG: DNA polymerase III subunit delta' [Anaerolineales bacterium]|nr:DNA polymerase III subunit delta' [Anaerolineales bacterium]